MSMPKGYKVKGGYATVADDLGIGYREIADEMTAAGYKMNHSTVPRFQSSISDILSD